MSQIVPIGRSQVMAKIPKNQRESALQGDDHAHQTVLTLLGIHSMTRKISTISRLTTAM